MMRKPVTLHLTAPDPGTRMSSHILTLERFILTKTSLRKKAEGQEFNPYIRCHEVDVIRATSCSQSSSIDHGRSLIYEICQHLRNGEPIPESWRIFLEQSDVKDAKKLPLHWLLPIFWVLSGVLGAIMCVIAKRFLVGKKKEGETVLTWSNNVFLDTIWQALRTLVGDYFMEMTSGSILFVVWMKLMGADVDSKCEAYVDSMGALLNPEMVKIEKGGCIGREALLFGHTYEEEGGKVKFGQIKIGEEGYIGSRAVAMPGVRVESGGNLSALSLAMKEEIIR
ncbi:AMP-dependent synthetase/ligase [Quillaja saponaria]|uniref:AMP-dependent synthetase/ligase n=1 Tax=Quillaja saponaria TaxID=32244 RepID=A0AAD7PAC9_QUISA|nr:AMP-dependent synthetase/ligase [Quillaja saponaria]